MSESFVIKHPTLELYLGEHELLEAVCVPKHKALRFPSRLNTLNFLNQTSYRDKQYTVVPV